MRLIALLCTLVALGAAGLAGQALWQEVIAPDTLPEHTPQGAKAPEAAPASPPRPARRWPSLFGERQPPNPPAPPVEAKAPPQPPSSPKPPLASLGYTLKGVVRAGPGTWAMVGHPTGDRLLRVGDMLEPEVTVVRIDEQGIWVSRDGDAPEVLTFPE